MCLKWELTMGRMKLIKSNGLKQRGIKYVNVKRCDSNWAEISVEMNGMGGRLEAYLQKEGLSFLALVVLWRFPPAQCYQSPLPIYTSTGKHEHLLATVHAITLLVDIKGVTAKSMAGCLLYMEVHFPQNRLRATEKLWNRWGDGSCGTLEVSPRALALF